MLVSVSNTCSQEYENFDKKPYIHTYYIACLAFNALYLYVCMLLCFPSLKKTVFSIHWWRKYLQFQPN